MSLGLYRVRFADTNLTQDIKMGYYGDKVVYRQFCPRLQAVIDYALSQGYTKPDYEYLKHLDKLFIGMEDIFLKMDLFYIFSGAGDQTFKCINVITPTKYELTPVGNLVWYYEYVQGDGVSAYFNTNFIPLLDGLHYTQDSAARGTIVKDYNQNWGSESTYLDGDSSSGITSKEMMQLNIEGFGNIASKNGDQLSFTSGGNGLRSLVRLNQNVKFYNNSALSNTTDLTSDRVSSYSQNIFKTNANSSSIVFSKLGISIYYMGEYLTNQEITIMYNAFNQYFIDCGMATI